ncbi:MAG: hypothetical protein ACI9VR_004259 [Cognaticolwellia sp.]|jgi:hypothetical protein
MEVPTKVGDEPKTQPQPLFSANSGTEGQELNDDN